MANNKPATPAQREAQKYNFKLRQLKGMTAALHTMRERTDCMEADIVNIWVDHCLSGIEQLEQRVKYVRTARIVDCKNAVRDER